MIKQFLRLALKIIVTLMVIACGQKGALVPADAKAKQVDQGQQTTEQVNRQADEGAN